jgi:hypothetical protein
MGIVQPCRSEPNEQPNYSTAQLQIGTELRKLTAGWTPGEDKHPTRGLMLENTGERSRRSGGGRHDLGRPDIAMRETKTFRTAVGKVR